MPVEQRDTQQTFRALALGLGAVAASVGFFALVLWATDRGSVEVSLGTSVLEAGDAINLAKQIDEEGPIIYGDLLGGEHNIFLQHLGDDPESGWYAFEATRTTSARRCSLRWDKHSRLFRDSCDETIEIEATGEGQRRYLLRIEEGTVIIDFREPAD